MNVGQIKTKIFLIRSMDMVFLLAVFSFGVYAVLYSEQTMRMGLVTLVGLFLVNKLGNLSTNRIAALRQQIKKAQREEKLADQRRR